jgi:hypothetical protein
MTANTSTHLDPLLQARPIVLWVEDRFTREYLSTVWQPEDQLFQILIAGGNETVAGVVHDQREQGYRHVFGLTDRDFGESNYDRWQNLQSELEVFKARVFEIENYLLDWDALAGCSENSKRLGRSSDTIRQQAEALAGGMVWWMDCRSVLADYRSRLVGNYPKHPKLGKIGNLAEAESYIRDQTWFLSFPGHAAHLQNVASLAADLTAAHAVQHVHLQDGTWTRCFSGKELFRQLRGHLFNQDYASPEEMDVDLAKSVAEWQVQNGAVPPEMAELKAALRQRVSL